MANISWLVYWLAFLGIIYVVKLFIKSFTPAVNTFKVFMAARKMRKQFKEIKDFHDDEKYD